MILLGNKIKQLRIDRNFKQSDLCNELLNRSILSKIENGKAYPSIPQLQHLATIFNVPMTFFFDNSDSTNEITSEIGYNFNLYRFYKENDYFRIIKYVEYNKQNFIGIGDHNKYFYYGMALFNIERHMDALKPLKRYLNFYKISDDTFKEKYAEYVIECLNALCKIILINNNSDKALKYLSLAKNYIYKYNLVETKLSAVIHCNLGSLYYRTLRYKETINLLENFLNHPENVIYVDVFATLNFNLSISYHNLDQHDKAIIYLKKCMNLSQYYGDLYKEYILYCTYSTFLIHDKNFAESIHMISYLKNNYKLNAIAYNNLLAQEILTYFIKKDYNKCLDVCKEITLNKLTKAGKIDYYFIKGFITEDVDLLKRCENYFINKFYFKDLIALYEKLYEITGETKYLDSIKLYENIPFSKNILI
ncbi:MAG: helix-turn-helix transcriptional regulator [Clostridium sp.]